MKKIFLLFLVLATLPVSSKTRPEVTYFTVDTTKRYQKIDGFGASDCWSMQWVGQWPDNKKNQIADWLFSTENDEEGNPLGIGLSIWRFNVGAGSQEQGDESQIGSKITRQESFLSSDGISYDWTKLKGQRWFLQAAKKRGVPTFLAFLNSPPVQMTQNGLATNTGRDSTLNLRSECLIPFVRYLADIVEGIRDHEGITIDYLCPVNEPDGHWNWYGPKQEGSPALNSEIATLARLAGNEFTRRGLSTMIVVNESSDYRCMYGTHMTGSNRGYAVQQFFTPDSVDTYVGDVPNIAPFIAGHSYWTNTPLQTMKDIRKTLRDTVQSRNIGFWQTETCIMSNDDELNGGWGFDASMKTALYVARIIHHDMVFADAGSWSWWRAIGGNYKDGLLYMAEDKTLLDGEIADSKLLWALGNYSRFIRPGAIRVGVKAPFMRDATNPVGLMCSAYENADGSISVVIINYADEDLRFMVDLGKICQLRPYLTSKGNANLMPQNIILSDSVVTIPSRSIMTLVTVSDDAPVGVL